MWTANMAMAWLYLNHRTAALFVRRALQAALDTQPEAYAIRTEVNVLLYETSGLKEYVDVTVTIPETNTAKELLPFLEPSATFERTKMSDTGSDALVWILGGELWLTIVVLGDGLLHVVIQPRDVT